MHISSIDSKIRKKEHFNCVPKQWNENINSAQEEKDWLLDNLKTNLRNIDDGSKDPVEIVPGAYTVSCDEHKNFYITVNDEQFKTSPEHILYAVLWGIDFKLEPSNFGRGFLKQFITTVTRAKIANLYDYQLAAIGSFGSEILDGKRQSYHRSLNHNTKSLDQQNEAGVLAELLVLSFFNKLCFRYQIPLSLERTNVKEDVANSIDFVLIYKSKLGIVKKEIQFTTATKLSLLNKKRNQVSKQNGDHSNGLSLIQIPIQEGVMQAFERWLQSDAVIRTTSTPDDYLSITTKREIFNNIISVLPNEINKYLNQEYATKLEFN